MPPKILKRIPHGEILPKGYGIAYRENFDMLSICLPVPLNILAGLMHNAWIFLKYGWRDMPLDPRAAFHAGYQKGKQDALSGMGQRTP